jgi:pimeloyl-ACP methyl ester carboxylesterase
MTKSRMRVLIVLATGVILALMVVGYRAGRYIVRRVKAQRYVAELGGNSHEVSVGGYRGIVILSRQQTGGHSAPWIWYAPTLRGGYPGDNYKWLFQNLLSKGISLAGLDIGESYGNEKGRAAYTGFYDFVVAKYGLSPRPCLLAQSRGGLMLYNWAEENTDKVSCVGGVYPVTDLESWPGLGDERLQAAYGMSEAALRSGLARFNPIDRLAGLARLGIPVLHLHGDADAVVPLLQNTFEFARRYNESGGRAEFVVVRGKGHDGSPEYFQSQQMLDFLLSSGQSAPRARAAIAYSGSDKSAVCIWENAKWAPRPPCKVCFETCAAPPEGVITKIEYRCEGAGCASSFNPLHEGGYGPLCVISPDRRSITWARRWDTSEAIKDIYTIRYRIEPLEPHLR